MSKGSSKQVIFGAILSYVLIIANAVYGMVITPYILGCLGQEEYGVYKTIASLSSSLMVLDLGLGGTVTRYIAKYKAEKKEGEIPNFLALMLMETGVIVLLVAAICTGFYFFIGPMYSETLSESQIGLAQKLFVILSANMVLHIVENVVNGVITGHNDFIFGNGVKLLRLAFRVTLVLVILNVFPNSIALVLIDLAMTILFLVIEICWVAFKHRVKIKYTRFEKHLFSESFVYTGLMFLTSIINQVNGNLDNVVIGAVVGASAVTVYSMGLTIFAMFEQLSTSISGVMLPSVTNILQEENGLEKAKDIVIKAGRVQFVLLGAVLAGFAILGQDFVNLWLGDGYEDVYFITLVLMVPALFELCVNVCLSILRAKNLLLFRTLVLAASTIFNAIFTYFGTKMYGYYAACLGTAISWLVGSDVIMNIYYYKKFGFNMFKVYGGIIGRNLFSLLIASGCTFAVHYFLNGSWWAFLLNVFIFCAIYAFCLLLFGLKPEEKEQLKRRLIKKRELNK